MASAFPTIQELSRGGDEIPAPDPDAGQCDTAHLARDVKLDTGPYWAIRTEIESSP